MGELTVNIAIATTVTIKTLEERNSRYRGLGLPIVDRWEISTREPCASLGCMREFYNLYFLWLN
jgi:hypothetical protein